MGSGMFHSETAFKSKQFNLIWAITKFLKQVFIIFKNIFMINFMRVCTKVSQIKFSFTRADTKIPNCKFYHIQIGKFQVFEDQYKSEHISFTKFNFKRAGTKVLKWTLYHIQIHPLQFYKIWYRSSKMCFTIFKYTININFTRAGTKVPTCFSMFQKIVRSYLSTVTNSKNS